MDTPGTSTDIVDTPNFSASTITYSILVQIKFWTNANLIQTQILIKTPTNYNRVQTPDP